MCLAPNGVCAGTDVEARTSEGSCFWNITCRLCYKRWKAVYMGHGHVHSRAKVRDRWKDESAQMAMVVVRLAKLRRSDGNELYQVQISNRFFEIGRSSSGPRRMWRLSYRSCHSRWCA